MNFEKHFRVSITIWIRFLDSYYDIHLSRIVQANLYWAPMVSTEDCVKTVLDSIRRGDEYLTVPRWMGIFFMWKTLCPEMLKWITRFLFITCSKYYQENKKSCLSDKGHIEWCHGMVVYVFLSFFFFLYVWLKMVTKQFVVCVMYLSIINYFDLTKQCMLYFSRVLFCKGIEEKIKENCKIGSYTLSKITLRV